MNSINAQSIAPDEDELRDQRRITQRILSNDPTTDFGKTIPDPIAEEVEPIVEPIFVEPANDSTKTQPTPPPIPEDAQEQNYAVEHTRGNVPLEAFNGNRTAYKPPIYEQNIQPGYIIDGPELETFHGDEDSYTTPPFGQADTIPSDPAIIDTNDFVDRVIANFTPIKPPQRASHAKNTKIGHADGQFDGYRTSHEHNPHPVITDDMTRTSEWQQPQTETLHGFQPGFQNPVPAWDDAYKTTPHGHKPNLSREPQQIATPLADTVEDLPSVIVPDVPDDKETKSYQHVSLNQKREGPGLEKKVIDNLEEKREAAKQFKETAKYLLGQQLSIVTIETFIYYLPDNIKDRLNPNNSQSIKNGHINLEEFADEMEGLEYMYSIALGKNPNIQKSQ